MPEAPGQPSSPTQPQANSAAGPKPGQSPMGTSPATGPTQNRGYEVAAIKMAGMGLKVLEMVIPLAGSASELGKAVMDSIRKITPYVPPGSVTPADMQNMIQSLMIRQQQFGQNMQAMRRPAPPQSPGAAAPPGAGAGTAPPPMQQAA